jgi:hypothetical protein
MGSKGWPHIQFDKPSANEWGRPNLVHTVEEKPSKAKQNKKKIFDKDTTKLPLSAMHKISNVCNENPNANKKGC